MSDSPTEPAQELTAPARGRRRWVILGLLVIVGVGALAFLLLASGDGGLPEPQGIVGTDCHAAVSAAGIHLSGVTGGPEAGRRVEAAISETFYRCSSYRELVNAMLGEKGYRENPSSGIDDDDVLTFMDHHCARDDNPKRTSPVCLDYNQSPDYRQSSIFYVPGAKKPPKLPYFLRGDG